MLVTAAREVFRRLLDAVDPALTGRAEDALVRSVPRLGSAVVYAYPATARRPEAGVQD